MATIGVHPSADGATSYSVNGQQMVTEREAVERERAAFVHGAALFGVLTYGQGMAAEREAAARYPLPKVTRPRVERDPHIPSIEWKVQERSVWGRDTGDANGEWSFYAPHVSRSPERVALWADLIANPTEEVEEVTP